ncbi:flagellar assembly protein FliH [Sphingomonas sp. SUN039]|uniref:flagellar assembly protein FliH n=1 Tax=Sphingomonas sp. SUN039 TaxID=2937787 RepID=UPI0021643679|nr:flagellar assembly protein FliH [Sphingomonas sp. SUN039]UVO52900.1 flagellar assembly protein FliH [Sphingomonas sp. SUN039]
MNAALRQVFMWLPMRVGNRGMHREPFGANAIVGDQTSDRILDAEQTSPASFPLTARVGETLGSQKSGGTVKKMTLRPVRIAALARGSGLARELPPLRRSYESHAMRHASARSPNFHRALPDDAYSRGVADGRRTVEAEIEAERQAVAILANSLASLADELVVYLNPQDIARIGEAHFDIRTLPDATVPPGGVRAAGRA